MDKLGAVLLRLERAVARLEAALAAMPEAAAREARRELAGAIARHVDTALARIDEALGGEEGMAEIAVTVNGRSFAPNCVDGQEGRTRRLAQYVDAKVRAFVKSLGQVGEMRLLVLAALVIADELAEANQALEEERRRARSAGEAVADAAASRIVGLAERIEAIAARLEAS